MQQPRLLDQVRGAIRVWRYGIRIDEACTQWIRRYILFHNKQHPRDLGEAEIASFLTCLAMKKHVAVSIRNQALSSLLSPVLGDKEAHTKAGSIIRDA